MLTASNNFRHLQTAIFQNNSVHFIDDSGVMSLLGRLVQGSTSKLAQPRLNSVAHFFTVVNKGPASPNTFFISLKISVGVKPFLTKHLMFSFLHFQRCCKITLLMQLFLRNNDLTRLHALQLFVGRTWRHGVVKNRNAAHSFMW